MSEQDDRQAEMHFDLAEVRRRIEEREEALMREEERDREREAEGKPAKGKKRRRKAETKPRRKWPKMSRNELLEGRVEKFMARTESITETFAKASGRLVSLNALLIEAQGGYQEGTLYIRFKACNYPPCGGCPHAYWHLYSTKTLIKGSSPVPAHQAVKAPRRTRTYQQNKDTLEPFIADMMDLLEFIADCLKTMRYLDRGLPRCRILES